LVHEKFAGVRGWVPGLNGRSSTRRRPLGEQSRIFQDGRTTIRAGIEVAVVGGLEGDGKEKEDVTTIKLQNADRSYQNLKLVWSNPTNQVKDLKPRNAGSVHIIA